MNIQPLICSWQSCWNSKCESDFAEGSHFILPYIYKTHVLHVWMSLKLFSHWLLQLVHAWTVTLVLFSRICWDHHSCIYSVVASFLPTLNDIIIAHHCVVEWCTNGGIPIGQGSTHLWRNVWRRCPFLDCQLYSDVWKLRNVDGGTCQKCTCRLHARVSAMEQLKGGSTDHLPHIHFQKTIITHICLSIYTSVKQGESRGERKNEGGG